MAKQWISQIIRRLKSWLTSPGAELNRTQRTIRYFIDLTWSCGHQLHRDRAGQMAAALSYRTVFSLIPLLVVALLVFKAFGAFDQAGDQIRSQLEQVLGIDEASISATQEAEAQDAETQTDAPTAAWGPNWFVEQADSQGVLQDQGLQVLSEAERLRQLQSQAFEIMDEITANLSRISFGSIGTVGLALLVWAALRLIVSMEESFNLIVKADRRRSWAKRILNYWAVVTLGPLLLAASLYLAQQAVQSTSELAPWIAPWIRRASRLTSFATAWIMLWVLYRVLPTVALRNRALMAGAFVSAVLWEVWKFAFAYYFLKSKDYSLVYGSLALIPIFLIWVYVTWMIVLFGLSLAHALHSMPRSRHRRRRLYEKTEEGLDRRWVLPIMAAIGERFERGLAMDADELAVNLDLPPKKLRRLLHALQDDRLLHEVAGEDDGEPGFTLAQPPDQIELTALFARADREAGGPAQSHRLPGHDWLARLQDIENDALTDAMLSDVLRPQEAPENA